MSDERGELETADGIVDDTRISFFVVGVFPNGRVYILRLNEQRVWECRDFEVQAILHYILSKAECRDEAGNFYPGMEDEPARLLGIVRSQQEGDKIQTYHTLLPNLQGEENTSAFDAEMLETAAARIGYARGQNPKPGDLEFFIEGVKFFEANLGPIRWKE